MSYIAKLLTGAFEKNISAKAKIGKYRIDMEYITNGVNYFIFKEEKQIAFISRNVVDESFIIRVQGATGTEMVGIHSAIQDKFPNSEIKMSIEKTIEEKYLENPNECPFCQSDDIEATTPFEATDEFGFQEIRCKDCKRRWSEGWKLNDVRIIEE